MRTHRSMTRPAPNWWSNPSAISKYGVAVASVGGALVAAVWLENYLAGAPVSLLLCAVMFSAWFGGVGSGVLAVSLAVLTFKYYIMPSRYSWAVDIDEVPRLVFFALSVLFVG